MAECEIPEVSEYSGAENCVGDADVQRLAFCQSFSYLKDTLVPYINDIFVIKLNACVEWIATQRDAIQDNKDSVDNSKTYIESVVNAEFLGEWTTGIDYTGKSTIYNGALWIGLSPIMDEAPAVNEKWLFVSFQTQKVEISSDYTASMGDIIYVDSSTNDITITLPAPIENGEVKIIDAKGEFEEHIPNIAPIDATIWLIDDSFELEKNLFSGTVKCYEVSNGIFDWRIE